MTAFTIGKDTIGEYGKLVEEVWFSELSQDKILLAEISLKHQVIIEKDK